MRPRHAEGWSRRAFLGGLTLTGAAGLLGPRLRPAVVAPPPEPRRLRVYQIPGICIARHPVAKSTQLLADGEIDVLIGLPPVPQELRARKIGQVILNSGVDHPWSQYFCRIVASNRTFVRQHPAATTQALRAPLKAADICAVEAEQMAQRPVDKGFTPRTTTPSGGCRGLPMLSGATTIPGIRCASMLSACTRSA
jgi:ABC-type nitrate/sulfonate/bicarbonate transport system substrate-binding protein